MGSPKTDLEQESLLQATGLTVKYGEIIGLRDVDMTIGQDQFVSVIGPNGAGKSTLADTLMGFLPYEGSLKFKGREISEMSTDKLVEIGVSYCSEDDNIFDFMSVESNLKMGAYKFPDIQNEQLEYVYKIFPKLRERKEQNGKTLSGGERKMLAIGRALMLDPEFLIIDEPTMGLAPTIINDIGDAIADIRADGVPILMLEQNVTFAFEHADKVYLLENGSVALEGTSDDIKDDDYIQEVYLGDSLAEEGGTEDFATDR